MPKIINYSDVHFGISTALLPYQISAMVEMDRYAESEGISIAVCTGDMFHTPGRLAVETMFAVRKYFKESPLKHIAIVGNHDYHRRISVQPLGNTTTKLSPSSLGCIDEFVTVVDQPTGIGRHGLSACYVPYTEDKNHLYRTLRQFISSSTTPHNILYFLHQGVSGHPIGSDFVIKNEIFDPTWVETPELHYISHVFTGHYHTHADVTDKVTIVGSMGQLNWGDKNQKKGFLVIDTDECTYEFIEQNIYPEHIEIPFKFIFTGTRILGLENDAICKLVGVRNHLKILHTQPGREDDLRESLAPTNPMSIRFEYDVNEAVTLNASTKDFSIRDIVSEVNNDLTPREVLLGEHIRTGNYCAPKKT